MGLFIGATGHSLMAQRVVAQGEQRPNVLFILTDDQGSIDAHCYGAKDLCTPGMDRLAQTGVRFTQFYVAAPVCSPSRASLLTGRCPQAAGLPGNASSHQGHAGMPTEQVTIAEVMKASGYTTAHIGKWHLGYTPKTMPNGQGFDYSFGHMGGCIDNYSHFFYWDGPNRHDLWENGKPVWADGKYFPDLMAGKVDNFLEDHKSDPFFLYYAINMPHYPLQPTARWREYYKDMPMPRRDYAAFVSTVDERIDRVLDKLEELGLRENTIVIYQSDHGHSVEDRTFGGGGNSGPFRGCKFSLFEGGIRIPAIISWPGHIPQNKVRSQMAVNVDWFPTIAQMCGIKEILSQVEGKSLVPMIENPKAKGSHNQFWWKNGIGWAVRDGDWKLLGNPQDASKKYPLDPDKDQLFLVNLSKDSTERVNLAQLYPQRVEQMKRLYMSWPYASEEDLPLKMESFDHKALGKKVELKYPTHPKYRANGAGTLVDGKSGSRVFGDGRWLGFEKSDLEATIDMGASVDIHSLSVGMLQDAQNYIFLPRYIEVSWSVDGAKFSKPIKKEIGMPEKDLRIMIKRESLQWKETSARYLRVKVANMGVCPTWHVGSGQKAFLFVDEIVVE